MITRISETQVQLTITLSVEDVAGLPRHFHAVLKDTMTGDISPAGRCGIVYMLDILDEALPSEAQMEQLLQA